MTEDSESLPPIVQVIGVAYTFKPSLAVRHHLTKSSSGDHSSKDRDFSYFYKGDQKSINDLAWVLINSNEFLFVQ